MKLPNNLNIAKLTFISILLIALSSGCFFAGKNWNTWFPNVVERSKDPELPTPQPGPVDGNGVDTPTNGELYTDFVYEGTTYRVEKSLLTEAGSKFNVNKRIYRYVNSKWEMKEEPADAKWKPATPSSDIPLILTKWDTKFKTEEAKNKADLAQTSPLPATQPLPSPPKDPKPPKTPPTEIPKMTTPTKETKPPKVTPPPKEIPKVTPPTLSPAQKAAKFKEIEKEVRYGKCDRDCIVNKVKEFLFSASDQQRLMNQMP